METGQLPQFSKISRDRLNTVTTQLRSVIQDAIKVIDFSVIYGHRTEAEQTAAVVAGNSKVSWPNSKHNSSPSLAVDIAPYPIDWGDRERFVYLAGVVKGIGAAKGVKIRWGGDWDSDNDLHDQTFMDLAHFELVQTSNNNI